MKSNSKIVLSLVLLSAATALAQTAPAQQQGAQPGQGSPAMWGMIGNNQGTQAKFAACNEQYFTLNPSSPNNSSLLEDAATPPAKRLSSHAVTKIIECIQWEKIAEKAGGSVDDSRDMKPSADGQIACVKRGGVTQDWSSCLSALGTYNTVVGLEAALMLTQRIRTDQNNARIGQEVQMRTAQGDSQNAAFDAMIETNRQQSAMNQEQAMAFAGAVAMLYSKVRAMPGKNLEALIARCGPPGASQNPTPEALTAIIRTEANKDTLTVEALKGDARITCSDAMSYNFRRHQDDLIANEMAKAFFQQKAMEYAGKAIAAGIKSQQLSNIANRTAQAKEMTEEEAPTMFDRCVVTPLDPQCAPGPGERIGGGAFSSGGLSFEGGMANNFGNGLEDGGAGLTDDLGSLPSTGDSVADVNSPFMDDVKRANDILNPSAAANMQPGSPQNGGAGGAATPAGAGGASLGNDLQGDQSGKNKEKDIDANKASGNYAFGKGGFQGVKPMREDNKNPFASLFDSKAAGGGVEEDRSIASDSGGRDSGLFKRISKKYEQVQADKRIESKNLE
jgi:hypothetical protein